MQNPVSTTAATASPLSVGSGGQGNATWKTIFAVITSGSFVVAARPLGSTETPINVAYYLNGSGTVTAAGTAVAASGIITIDDTGLEIVLVLTALVAKLYIVDSNQ